MHNALGNRHCPFVLRMRKKEVLLLVPALGHAEAGDGEGRTYGYVTQNKHMALNPMGFVR